METVDELVTDDVETILDDMLLALDDIDDEDTEALYKRAGLILDDIHSGRF